MTGAFDYLFYTQPIIFSSDRGRGLREVSFEEVSLMGMPVAHLSISLHIPHSCPRGVSVCWGGIVGTEPDFRKGTARV